MAHKTCPTCFTMMFHDGRAFNCSICGLTLVISLRRLDYENQCQNVVSTPPKRPAYPMQVVQSNAANVVQSDIETV
jgi:uncharacterized Zn finger protein (UPF0148 family)